MHLYIAYDEPYHNNGKHLNAYKPETVKDAPIRRAPDDARVVHAQNVPIQERKLENEERHEQHEVCRERGFELAVVVLGETGVLIDKVIVVLRSESRKTNELEKHRR